MNTAVSRGLSEHIRRHQSALSAGHERLGWKVAFNPPAIQEQLNIPGSLVAGLTRETLLEAGQPHSLTGARAVALEAEVAVRLMKGIHPGMSRPEVCSAIGEWAPAIEVVDFDRPLQELETILAEGVFHRALVTGAWVVPTHGADLSGIRAQVRYADEALCDVDAREATGDAPAILAHLARLLAGYGEGLARGDVVILGSMNPMTLAQPNTKFSLTLGGAGAVSLRLIP